jgi:phosphoribosylglycinamide formyltransferase-1
VKQALRFAFVSSSAGSIMDNALHNPLVRHLTHGLVCDHVCPAIERARGHGVPVEVIPEREPEVFGERLLDYLHMHRIDYVLSFYTQFYSAVLRDAYRDRILNFHPSLLPAFKGMDGFGDGLRHGVKVLGSTVELIDEVMDEGKIVMQTFFAFDQKVSEARLRHRLFVQQCKSLLQVAKWLVDGRVRVEGRRVTVEGAEFGDPEFSPGLDWDEAAQWAIPFPGAEAPAGFGSARTRSSR